MNKITSCFFTGQYRLRALSPGANSTCSVGTYVLCAALLPRRASRRPVHLHNAASNFLMCKPTTPNNGAEIPWTLPDSQTAYRSQ